MTTRGKNTDDVNANFAEWTPYAVRKFATFWEVDERCRPLLTDARMRNVWPVIMRQKLINPTAFDAPYFAHAKRYLFSSDDNFSPSELGCVVWFHRVQQCASGDVVTRKKLEETLTQWRDAATFLREVERGVAAGFDPKLAACAAYVREYLERNAAAIDRGIGPLTVDRGSKKRGKDDAVRVVGRRVAETTREVFGAVLAGTSAAVISVLTGENVNRKDVENWTKAPQ